MIEQAAARYGLDPSVLYGLIEQESGFDPSASSSAGARGLTQLMPSTAASLGVTEPLDPAQSIEGGARYLSGAAPPVRRQHHRRARRLQRRARRRRAVRRRPPLPRNPAVRRQSARLRRLIQPGRAGHGPAPTHHPGRHRPHRHGGRHRPHAHHRGPRRPHAHQHLGGDRMSPTAPQPIPAAPAGREPTLNGAPPGAPPDGPPFQSALETESARTAIAEGQQRSRSQNPSQNPSPAEGEQANSTEAVGLPPRGSAQPPRRHSEHHVATPSGTKATGGSAPSAPTPAGSTLTSAVAPTSGTPTDEPVPSASGGDSQGPAARSNTNQADPVTVRGGAPAPGALANAATTHDDAPGSSPTSAAAGPSAGAAAGLPVNAAAGPPASAATSPPTTPQDLASTAGAPATATPRAGTPPASGIATPVVATANATTNDAPPRRPARTGAFDAHGSTLGRSRLAPWLRGALPEHERRRSPQDPPLIRIFGRYQRRRAERRGV